MFQVHLLFNHLQEDLNTCFFACSKVHKNDERVTRIVEGYKELYHFNRNFVFLVEAGVEKEKFPDILAVLSLLVFQKQTDF